MPIYHYRACRRPRNTFHFSSDCKLFNYRRRVRIEQAPRSLQHAPLESPRVSSTICSLVSTYTYYVCLCCLQYSTATTILIHSIYHPRSAILHPLLTLDLSSWFFNYSVAQLSIRMNRRLSCILASINIFDTFHN